jgi:hypothetical protein
MKANRISGPLLCATTAMMLWAGAAVSADWPRQGTINYVIHYVMQPINTIDVDKLGKAVALEMVGTTANMEGKSLMDKMIAHCVAIQIDSGKAQYMNGGCTMTDKDGDRIFTTFDTRELEGALPRFGCGTHTITNGSGKYKGITGKEPFNCIILPTSAPGQGWSGMDIEHQMNYKFQ